MTDDSVPIRKVADHFGLPLSTLHYWERRGLVTPHRRAGMRCYDTDQLYRIALIRLWRGTGTMSLDEIASLLAGPAADGLWRRTVVDRIAAIEAQRTRLGAAQTYLSHLLTCPHDEALDRCPGFRSHTPVPPFTVVMVRDNEKPGENRIATARYRPSRCQVVRAAEYGHERPYTPC